MLDVSDGLAGDAGHLAAASRVAIRIELERIPCHPAVSVEAAAAGEPAPVFAAKGGEDYELLVVLPRDHPGAEGFSLRRIGEVRAGEGLTLELAGQAVVLSGYEHFA